MTGWIILGVIVGIIILILCLRVSVRADFGEELRVTARIGPMKMQIIPPPEKKPKKGEAEKKAPEAEQKPKEKKKPDLHLTFADIRNALSAVWQSVQGTLRRAGRRIRIDPLNLSLVFGDENPVNTAQWYGWASTAVWTVMPWLEKTVHMPDPRIHMEMDFNATQTKVSGTVGASYRIGDLLAIGFAAAWPLLRFGIPFLKKQRAIKKAAAKQAAAEKGKPENTEQQNGTSHEAA